MKKKYKGVTGTFQRLLPELSDEMFERLEEYGDWIDSQPSPGSTLIVNKSLAEILTESWRGFLTKEDRNKLNKIFKNKT